LHATSAAILVASCSFTNELLDAFEFTFDGDFHFFKASRKFQESKSIKHESP
jgi:hypothetical protein